MNEAGNPERLVVGVMTGTSLDAIDVALVAIAGRGLAMSASLVRRDSVALGELADPLREAASQSPLSAATFVELAYELGGLHVPAIRRVIENDRVDLVAVHGQTVYHAPPLSWQLVDVGPIAAAFGCPVVYDLRQADLRSGGRGAPITPLADWVLFRHPQRARVIVNLGGFCNVTVLPAGSEATPALVRGFDVCVCNQLLDAVAREKLGRPFDDRGAAALSGKTDRDAGLDLYDLLTRQRRSGRALGTGDEAAGWLHAHKYRMSGEDLAATAAEAVSYCIAEAVRAHDVDEVIVAGGGARNEAVIKGIVDQLRKPVRPSHELEIPVDAREAVAIAVLGALSADGIPITLAAVTGCSDPPPRAGAWVLPAGIPLPAAAHGTTAPAPSRTT